jgi:hypothetical protein
MADQGKDGSIAPRRSLSGPVLPPPPPGMEEEARKREADAAAAQQSRARKEADKQARQREKEAQKESARRSREDARRQKAQREEAQRAQADREQAQRSRRHQEAPAAASGSAGWRPGRPVETRDAQATTSLPLGTPAGGAASGATAVGAGPSGSGRPARGSGKGRIRRTRKAQLRLVQIDAWSVMKTSFLLSIALGIVLVVAVAIIMSVLGAAGVWDSINSIVQQAVGSDSGQSFDIRQYAGPSRVLGFTMIVAVVDVILITAIATLGAFLYNLSAALLGGIEVTLAEDS